MIGWDSWSKHHPGRVRAHPRIQNPYIHVQFPTHRGRKRWSPGYIPARCGNPNPNGLFFIGWGSRSQRRPRKIGSHRRIRNISMRLSQQTGDENGDPPGRCRLAWDGNPNPTGSLLISWDSWSHRHPRRIMSHPWIINHPIHLQLPPRRGRKWSFTGSIPPRTMWKPQLWAHHSWVGFVKPAVSTHWGQEGSASSSANDLIDL